MVAKSIEWLDNKLTPYKVKKTVDKKKSPPPAVFKEQKNKGLLMLARSAKLRGVITAHHMAFRLGPRINAAGRLGDSSLGVRLLSTESPTEILSIVAEMEDLNKKRQDIEIEIVNHSKNDIMVNSNSDRIRQVFDNLISNAIRYSERGKISIVIEDYKEEYLFFVSDTGSGINEESLSRIFERFYRTEDARTKFRKGTGLGLPIVKHIIEAHNSSINVDSVEGKGTTFSFALMKS